MKTAQLSFAVAALLYSASATQVQQMLTHTLQQDDGTVGWCDMDAKQRKAWIKSQWNAFKKQVGEAKNEFKAAKKEAVTAWKAEAKELRDAFKAQYKEMKQELKASIKELPKNERKAAWAEAKKELKAFKDEFKTNWKSRVTEFKEELKAIKGNFQELVQSLRSDTETNIESFKMSPEECEELESSSEEEPEPSDEESESEPEPSDEESESEPEPSDEESESEPEPSDEESEEEQTDPVKVSQTCDGSIQRLWNEQKANLFERAKTQTGPYQDVSFPADATSGYWQHAKLWSTNFAAKIRKMNFTKWQRVRDMNNGGSIWGSKGISPAGIRQGQLGDCWWLAQASALAEHPERIEKIFTNMDVEKGIYEFEMFSGGRAQKVVIDDKLPTNGNGRPMFAQKSLNGAWWLPLLEKASAKFFGTYENMNGGWGDIAHQQLTGYPSSGFSHSNKDRLLEVVKTADDKHHVMWVAGAQSGNSVGLVAGHQYSTLEHMVWDGIDFVQVRNPWSSGEYKGPYSDHDKTTDANKLRAFREHVKNEHSHDHNSNDGTFWMTFESYAKDFGYTNIGYYFDDYKATTFSRSLKSDGKVDYVLVNPVKQRVALQADPISMYQFMDEHCEDEKKPGSSKGRRSVTFVMNGKAFYAKTQSDYYGGFADYVDLPAGEYKLQATPSFSVDGNMPFSILAHASEQAVTINE